MTLPRPRSPWRAWAGCGIAMLAAWAVLSAWLPPDDPAYSFCMFRRLTGHDCATCGMTRALALLAHGDVRGSLARHPLALPFALEAVATWALAPIAIARRWRPSGALLLRALAVHLVILFGVWIVRWGWN